MKKFNLYEETMNLLAKKVLNKESFIAHQLTTELRNMFPSEEIYHADCNGILKTAFLSGAMGTDYKRELEPSFNPSNPPFLYQPVIMKAVKQFGRAIKTSSPAILPNSNTGGQNRIRVLKSDVEKAGFKVGEKIFLFNYNGMLIAGKKELKNATRLNDKSYTVDTKMNIRINLNGTGFDASTLKINSGHGIILFEKI